MNCPVCSGVALAMSNREGVEIDYCPQCRGVWLDRGELDKIIERSIKEYGETAGSASTSGAPPPVYSDREQRPQRDEQWDDDFKRDSYGGRRKKRSFLGDLFDFD